MNELEALDATGSQKGLSYTKSPSDLENLDYYSGASQLAFRQVALQAASAAFMTIQDRVCSAASNAQYPSGPGARRPEGPRRTLPAPRRGVRVCVRREIAVSRCLTFGSSMLVNLKVRTCIVLVLVLFTGAMFISTAWPGWA